MRGDSRTKTLVLLFLISSTFLPPAVPCATSGDALSKARQEAESAGYIFAANRDEILAKAKKEGKLRALSGLSTPTIKPMIAAFKKKYPFIDLMSKRSRERMPISVFCSS